MRRLELFGVAGACLVVLVSFEPASAQEAPSAPERKAEAKVYDRWPFDAKEAKRRQKEAAEALGIPVEKSVDLGGGVKMDLVLIPAGQFMMGSPDNEPGREKDEGPRLCIRMDKPYYIGKSEVTQAEWKQIMGKNPSHFIGDRNPVDSVSWFDAQDFIEKVNALIDKDNPKDTQGRVRLPTEPEWEYACRAGTETAFAFGAKLAAGDANFNPALEDPCVAKQTKDNPNGNKTHPVGSYAPNAFGLYDMHGNVNEWCADWFGDYKLPPDKRAEDVKKVNSVYYFYSRTLRGGGWAGGACALRSSERGSHPVWAPGAKNDRGRGRDSNIGFRVVLEAGK